MTEWDIGSRRNGKTSRMIERAHDENLYIVVANRKRALAVAKQARDMGKDILFPVTVKELPFKMTGNPYRMTHPGVLVDDADAVLETAIGMPVLCAASSGTLKEEER